MGTGRDKRRDRALRRWGAGRGSLTGWVVIVVVVVVAVVASTWWWGGGPTIKGTSNCLAEFVKTLKLPLKFF